MSKVKFERRRDETVRVGTIGMAPTKPRPELTEAERAEAIEALNAFEERLCAITYMLALKAKAQKNTLDNNDDSKPPSPKQPQDSSQNNKL